jgi:hypothetical protein
MSGKAIRTPASTESLLLIWIGASNEIGNSATAANGTIPQSRGKNNRDLDVAQTDVDFCQRAVSSGLGWSPTEVTLAWGDGRLIDGSPSTGPHLSPALVCACDLVDLGVPNMSVIVNSEGGKGIATYAAGGAYLTWISDRVADIPTTIGKAVVVMAMGLPDMGDEADSLAIAANLATIESDIRGLLPDAIAGAVHFFKWSPHSYFGPGGGDPQTYYDNSVSQHTTWANGDPRRHLIGGGSFTQLDQQSVSVADPSFGPHWGPEETADRGGIAARSIFDALAGG